MTKKNLHINNKEKRISIEQYNAEIEAALKEVKAGKVVSHEEVIAKTKVLLKRK